MNRPKILRVWGRADGFDLEFKKEGELWDCTVPPDTKDGQYAVEIHGVNEFGQTAYWTGTLYMCNGICHLELKEVLYVINFKKQGDPVRFLEQTHALTIRKGCKHYARQY